MFNDGDRVHIGAISQDIEKSLEDVGLTAMDFGGFCKNIACEDILKNSLDENGNVELGVFGEPIRESVGKNPILDENGDYVYTYALRYSEFIMLTVHMVQKLMKEFEEYKTNTDKQLQDTISKLESLENRLIKLENKGDN